MKRLNFNNIFLVNCIFLLWFGVAYLLNGLAIWLLIYAFMGGVIVPPTFWLWVHWFGLDVLPPVFLVGGLLSAFQALRGQDFKPTLFFSIGLFALTWTLVMVAILWLPGIMGWHW